MASTTESSGSRTPSRDFHHLTQEKYPEDEGRNLHLHEDLSVSLEQVRSNFARYDLLDGKVRFIKGFFSDTLPTASIEKLSVLRLDGDLYESTMDALNALYPKVSDGGYVIIDDYGVLPPCAKAVHDYMDEHGITAPLHTIDWTGRYFRKGDSAEHNGGPVTPIPQLDEEPRVEPHWFGSLRQRYHALVPLVLRKNLRDIRRELMN